MPARHQADEEVSGMMRGDNPAAEKQAEQQIERNLDQLLHEMGLARQREVDELRAALIALSNSRVKTANCADRISRSLSALMRDIPISSAVCVGCPMLVLASQIVAPTPAQAASAASECAQLPRQLPNPAAPPAELDPTRATAAAAMAPEASESVAQGSAADLLGGNGQQRAHDPPGLKITDLVEALVLKPKAATPSR